MLDRTTADTLHVEIYNKSLPAMHFIEPPLYVDGLPSVPRFEVEDF